MEERKEASLSPPLLTSDRLQITDVYEIATKIGLEFQKIIDEYGSPSVTNIIPMIVNALEQLEKVVEENEQLRIEHCRLAVQSDQLKEEREKRVKAVKEHDETNAELGEKCRQIEMLQQSISQLEEKVKQLEAVLAQENVSQALEGERKKNAGLVSSIETLQSELDRAKEKLKSNTSTLKDNEQQISQLSSDVDTLRIQLVSCQKRTLNKADTLDGKELMINIEPEPVDEDDFLKQAEERIEVLEQEKAWMQQEQMKLKKQLEEANEKLASTRESANDASASLLTNLTKPTGVKPTFYKEDLLRVLEDRDQLAMRVAELEDELKLLKPEGKEVLRRMSSPPKLSKVKEIMESLTVSVSEHAQKTSL